jgi:hypothetical protein
MAATKHPFYDSFKRVSWFIYYYYCFSGRFGGMPFVVMVHISDYHAPNVMYGTGFNPSVSLGLGSGARRLAGDPLGFPLDRPLYEWQIENLKNFWFEDVLIHHKPTPEVHLHYMD